MHVCLDSIKVGKSYINQIYGSPAELKVVQLPNFISKGSVSLLPLLSKNEKTHPNKQTKPTLYL